MYCWTRNHFSENYFLTCYIPSFIRAVFGLLGFPAVLIAAQAAAAVTDVPAAGVKVPVPGDRVVKRQGEGRMV